MFWWFPYQDELCIEHVCVYLTGPQEILDSICAPTAVVCMLIGKAIAQAVCATFIADATLNALIMRSVYTQCSYNEDLIQQKAMIMVVWTLPELLI